MHYHTYPCIPVCADNVIMYYLVHICTKFSQFFNDIIDILLPQTQRVHWIMLTKQELTYRLNEQ